MISWNEDINESDVRSLKLNVRNVATVITAKNGLGCFNS